MEKQCPHCNEVQTYVRLDNGEQVCITCKKIIEEKKERVDAPAVLSNKGGTRIFRT